MDKMKMELVWHSCKTCPPSEEHNDCLYLSSGDGVFDAEWDNGYWVDLEGREISNADMGAAGFWWADIDQTTAGFFKSVGLFKPLLL